MLKKKVVIYVDGGVCSQIYFFALGCFFETLGYDVKYDLRWFKTHGMDMDHKFDRSFVMNEAFPTLKYKTASKLTVWIYRHFFKKNWTETDIPSRLYVKGYFDLTSTSFVKYKDFFIQHFKPANLNLVQDLLDEIEKTNSCAVHVRRGDLARYNPFYGEPPTADYFVKAINHVLKEKPDSVFYFFSDEIDFVKDSIVPKLGKKVKYKLCDKNGSDKGYLDLYLIAHAKSIIASQGSFGKVGRQLNTTPELLFVSTQDIKY